MKRCVEEAAIIVTNEKEPRTSCTITLTSPIMREPNQGGKLSNTQQLVKNWKRFYSQINDLVTIYDTQQQSFYLILLTS